MAFKFNPRTALIAGAVPFFLSSDDRGYMQTALVTTPLIFAGESLLPGIFQTAQKETAAIREVFARHQAYSKPQDIAVEIANSMANSPSIQSMEKRQLRGMWRNFVVTPDMLNLKQQLAGTNRGERVSNTIEARYARQEAKRRLLSNALEASVRDSALPSEWRDLMSKSTAPLMKNEEMLAMYEKYQERPGFVRGLNNRLRVIGKGYDGVSHGLVDSGAFSKIPEEIPSQPATRVKFDPDFGEPWMKGFEKENQELTANLRKYMRRKEIDGLTAVAEMNVNGTIGRVLSIDIGTYSKMGKEHQFSLPIPGPNGQVSWGTDGGVGVGRYIIGPDERPHRIDVWLSKMLAEQPQFGLEDLEQDLAQGVYFNAIDPTDRWSNDQRLGSMTQGQSLLYPEQIAAKSKVATVSKLPIFGEGNRPFTGLTHIEHTKFVTRALNSGNYSLMIGESGVFEGRFGLRNLADIHPFGLPNADKQDAAFRSFSKEFRLHANDSGNISGDLKPRFTTTAYKELLGNDVMPEASLRVAGIAPEHRMLFGDLPDTLEGVQASKQSIVERFGKYMNPTDAEAMYGDIEATYGIGKGDVFKQFGRMGETEFWLNKDWADKFSVENLYRYELDELASESPNVNRDTVLGYMNREIVRPDVEGIIESVSQTKKGRLEAIIRHERSMDGAKIDVAGIKGLAYTAEDFDLGRGFMNSFYNAAGLSQHIPENVHAMTDLSYFTNKAESAQVELSMAGELMNALEHDGHAGLAQDYRSKIKSGVAGLDFVEGQMSIDHRLNPRDLEAGAKRMEALAEINQQFFEQAGKAIREAGAATDPILQGYLHSGSGNLYDYMLQNSLVAPVRAWNHTSAYVARNYSVTPDMESFMAANNQDAALATINARKKYYSGDKGMSLRFGHALTTGSYKDALGETVSDVTLPGGSLDAATNRAGTILDPTAAEYKDNFRIDLGEGGRHRYIPVPGSEAFGASSPVIGPGRYQSHDWQYKLRDVLKTRNIAERDHKIDKLLESYQDIYVGKSGAFRAPAFDPDAVTGFLRTKSSPDNIFDVGISPDVARRIRDRKVRTLLENEGVAHGMLMRQPISGAPHVRFRIDKNLTGHSIAADEELYRMLQGDADEDPVGLLVWGPNSPAAREAEEAIISGRQHEMVKQWQKTMGTGEIARYSQGTKLVSGMDRVKKATQSSVNMIESAQRRMAGAAIGSYSNLLTGIVENMARNAEVLADGRGTRLSQALYEIRQAPISARKAHVHFDLEEAVHHLNKLNEAFNLPEAGSAATQFQESLINLTTKLHGDDHPLVDYLTNAGDDIQALMNGRSEEAKLLSSIYTARGVGARKLAAKGLMNPMEILGPVHGGSAAAQASVSDLGAMNKELAASARRVSTSASYQAQSFMKAHGKTAAIALGGLAALGILTSPNRAPTASFANRRSGNEERPEVNIGTTDRVPGEPIAGAMAPTSPPRRIVPGPRGVKTGVVAPMQSGVDLEIHTRAEDRESAAERTKIVSRLTNSGHQNITVNYRGNKLNSLRTRERMRELRDNR